MSYKKAIRFPNPTNKKQFDGLLEVEGKTYEYKIFLLPLEKNTPEYNFVVDGIQKRRQKNSRKACLGIKKKDIMRSIDNEITSAYGFVNEKGSADTVSASIQIYKWSVDQSDIQVWIHDLCRHTPRGTVKSEVSPLKVLFLLFEQLAANLINKDKIYLMLEPEKKDILVPIYEKYGFAVDNDFKLLLTNDFIIMKKSIKPKAQFRNFPFLSKTMVAGSKTRKIGGKVIASGAYGCVFDPALKCNNKTKREKGRVTKLLMNENAAKELVEIADIEHKLRKNKNYKDYFLTYDAELCTPGKLTTTDLKDFAEKCKILPNITRQNINDNLDKVTAINLPHGGTSCEDYIYTDGSFEKLYKLHKSLVRLLKNGIVPMNKKHLYHCDIKDPNIMIDESFPDLKTRLIDWGLSVEYVPNKIMPLPNKWKRRPLQFNVPFSVILFSDEFSEKYSKYLKDGGEITAEKLKPFIQDYIQFWMRTRGEGHYKFINTIMFKLFSHDYANEPPEKIKELVEKEITMEYIADSLVDVLVHFTRFDNEGKFSLREYLETVYIKIVDIWGFLSIYYLYIYILSDAYSSLSENHKKIFKQLQFIYVEYLYNPRHTPIDMGELYTDLDILSQLLYKTKTGSITGYKKSSSMSDSVSNVSSPNARPKSADPYLQKSSSKHNMGTQ